MTSKVRIGHQLICLLKGNQVSFLLSRIQSETGVSSLQIHCQLCSQRRAGGYDPSKKIVVLCLGNFSSKKFVEDTLVHELVHMYDDSKFLVDWQDLRHHACSEVLDLLQSPSSNVFFALRFALTIWLVIAVGTGNFVDCRGG